MAEKLILFWRDIPTQVVVREGRKSAKRPLSARFMEAVDHAAMRAGARESEAYLADWRKSDPEPCSDALEAEAEALALALEAGYDAARLLQLVRQGGKETGSKEAGGA